MKKYVIGIAVIFLCLQIHAQVLTFSPLYPKMTDTITIIYNASLGNGALYGVQDVFMHTGVITTESVNQGDWLHKPAVWGELDSAVLMENLGNNLHKATFFIKNFYDLSSQEILKELCFVFRNADGSLAGKNADGSDFYIHTWRTNRFARFTAPVNFPLTPAIGNHVNLQVASIGTSMINLFYEGNLISQAYDSVLNFNLPVTAYGKHRYWFIAEQNGQTISDSSYFIVQQAPVTQNPPNGTHDGVNYINDSTVILQLFAPNKSFVYLISDLTNWELDPSYLMKKTPDGKKYWIELTGLISQHEYRYQYFVDNAVNIGDPYAEKFLDRWSDPQIHPIIYPNLISYPVNKTSQLVSVFHTGETPFQWTDQNFQRPDNRDLVIYELLVRDWHLWHNYQTILDSIDYFKRLGINAIELMPVMEYDGNDSWGYMPNNYFAPDKCYGTKTMLQHFVDKCHENGIAVIFDIVLNHASAQNPMARLYFDKEKGRPAADNPWFNQLIPHPFGYHSDFNHASVYTQAFIDSVLNYWATVYHIDGYRFDLSKGFTNHVSVTYNSQGDIIGTDLGAWAAYDADRIGYLERMANVIWSKHPGIYLILEHFADNSEETELYLFGFMIWAGMSANVQYNQASMGWWNDNSNFEWAVSYKARQWIYHNLIGYMESHDEERLMYRNITFGNMNVQGADTLYNTRNLYTALERMAQVAAFFFTVPGPKLMWQFGERGYDYSILWPSMTNESRTDKKPPKWDYMQNPYRVKLFKTYTALINLKTQYHLFRTSNYDMNTSSRDKRIRIFDDGTTGSGMACIVVGNFDVLQGQVWPEFSHAGYWYDYLTGDSILVNQNQIAGNNFTLMYEPGEYHIFTDHSLPVPDIPQITSDEKIKIGEINSLASYVYPNPFNSEQTICYTLPGNEFVTLKIFDILGNEVRTLVNEKQQPGIHYIRWNGSLTTGEKIKEGYYYYRICAGKSTESNKLLYIKG
ncbi:MAG: T9SS type A sorting domain-containing protein [Bacteroidia bacterium]|nr:T9SS type A sorting domain-containing protein [Bacteroidia bacterium]